MPGNQHFCAFSGSAHVPKRSFIFLNTCETTHVQTSLIFSLKVRACLKLLFRLGATTAFLALICFYWGQGKKRWSQLKAGLHHKEQEEKQLRSVKESKATETLGLILRNPCFHPRPDLQKKQKRPVTDEDNQSVLILDSGHLQRKVKSDFCLLVKQLDSSFWWRKQLPSTSVSTKALGDLGL